jgi:futalosine hydrolase
MIALLCSVRAESELLSAQMTGTGTVTFGSKNATEGTLAGREVVLCSGGMGKVNAAHAATLLLTRYAPEALVIFGIGGAYPSSGAAIGEAVLATEEIAGDEGVLTSGGFRDTEYIGIPLLRTAASTIFNIYRPSERLLSRALRSLAAGRPHLRSGTFVTLSTCTGTRERAVELEARYRALCENMEGAAAAHVAACHDVPWLEIRGISNLVEDRDMGKWDIAGASTAAQKAVLDILQDWGA